jgi:hypothetical protein
MLTCNLSKIVYKHIRGMKLEFEGQMENKIWIEYSGRTYIQHETSPLLHT